MKKLFSFLFVFAVAVATAQVKIDSFADADSGQQSIQEVLADELVMPPKAAAPARVPGEYFTRDEIEAHLRTGHKPAAASNKKFGSARRTPTAPKGAKAMPTPNITINNNMPASTTQAGVPKNPNMSGTAIIDPNSLPQGNGELTLALGADGSAYLHRDGGSSFDIWPILGILALVGLVLAIVAMARGNGGGGGGNHYHNYPPAPVPQPAPAQPQPAPAQNEGGAAPAAPFVPPAAGGGGAAVNHPGPAAAVPGWAQQAVYVMAWPSGGPAQDPSPAQPVVVNVHNHPTLAPAAAPAQQQPRRQRGGADPAPDPTPAAGT